MSSRDDASTLLTHSERYKNLLLQVDISLHLLLISSVDSVFTRDSIYAIARICHANSVCPSVTRVYCIKMAEHIIKILSLSDRPIILVFRHQGSLHKSDDFTPNVAKHKGVAIFDQYAAISRKRYGKR